MAVRPRGRWRSGTLAGLIEQPHQTDLLRGPKTIFSLRTLQSKYMFMGGINEDTVYISIQCRNDDDDVSSRILVLMFSCEWALT